MAKDDIKEVNTNASPTAYGWVFQVGAGITLVLDNMKEFTSLKMEGASDDIELNFEDGTIYAQAKSVTQIGDQRSASKNLKDSLKLLSSDASNGNALKRKGQLVRGWLYEKNLFVNGNQCFILIV